MTESVRQPQRSWLSAIAHRLWVFIVLFAIVPCGTIDAQSSITTATLIITNGASKARMGHPFLVVGGDREEQKQVPRLR